LNQFILKDYASWKLENHATLELFKENNNIVYQRLEPVFVVLEHIYELACETELIDEDMSTIFEIGFNYIHDQFNVIKIYFENLFQSNCEDFEHYAEMLLFLTYIFDVRTDLENNGVDSDVEELNEIETYIENMIMERREDYEYVRVRLNEALNKVFETIDYEYVSIVDIYVEIAENLGIYIYEDEDLVIGNDL
jgi:hypothetical protein